MADKCPKCGAAVAAEDRFCGACGTELGAPAAAPPPGVSAASLAEPRNLARIAQVVALLGFLLPWITVSCQGRVLAQVSGFDLAVGRAVLRNPFTGASQVHNSSPSLPVVVALVLVIAGLALSFNLRGARAALVNAGASAGALLLAAYEVLVSAGGAVRSQAAATRPVSGFERSLSDSIQVGTGSGFWLACLALAAAAFFYWRVGTGAASAFGSSAPQPPAPAVPESRTNVPRSDGAPPG